MKDKVQLMDVDAKDGKGATLEIVFATSVFVTAQGRGQNITVNDLTWPEPNFCSIPLTDTTQVTVSGTKVVLHLSAVCGPWPSTAYNAFIPAGALANSADVATSDKLMVAWSTVKDTTAPAVKEFLPTTGKKGVLEYTDFSLLFSEGIRLTTGLSAGSKTIVLKCISPDKVCNAGGGNKQDRSIDVTDAELVEVFEDGEVFFFPMEELASSAT